MFKLEFDGQEGRRILSALRERHKKLEKGIHKWADDFDPEKGNNMLEGERAYQALIHKFQESML